MDDLQISLIVIGVVIVLGVVLFNWTQSHRYQGNTEKKFELEYEDVLLEKAGVSTMNGRIEPSLNKEMSEVLSKEFNLESPQPTEITQLISEVESITTESISQITDYNSKVDYIADIFSSALISTSSLTEILHERFNFGKPVRWFGQISTGSSWEEIFIGTSTKGGYSKLRACLQLSDRSGPVSEVGLSEFRDMVQNLAISMNAVVDISDVRQAHAQAVLLDLFCLEVDVTISINIISKDSSAFTGTKIRALAEASGFKLEVGGMFNYRDTNNALCFSINNRDLTPFVAEDIRMLTTPGITFLFDVPRVENGDRVFDQMIHFTETFSTILSGIRVDDNGTPLSEGGIGKIKQRLISIQAEMELRGIPAGGEIALRLFV